MIHVWLVLDPETARVALQTHEPDDGTFPRGLRGRGWEIREANIDEQTWAALLSGQLDAPAQDDLHRTLWTENGATPWST